jgi:DNA-binding NarL/FixJ family response regulator
MIRIVLVDDHPVVRKGIRQMLAGHADIVVAGEAGDVDGLFALLAETPCDVVMLDIGLPGKSGMETLADLKGRYPGVAVVMLSIHNDAFYATRALKGGASGYLSKTTPPEEIVLAIRKVVMGRRHVCSALGDQVADLLAGDKGTAMHEQLSDRELEILRMITRGRKPQEIAAILHIAVGTVGSYRARILQKMGMSSTAELVRYAVENGI